MPSINHVQLVGRIAAAPEDMKPSPAGKRVTFLVETERDTTSDGEPKAVKDFHRIVAPRDVTDSCGPDLTVGLVVYIEGSLVNRGYEEGGEKRFITEIHAEDVRRAEPRDWGMSGDAPSTPK